MRNENSYAWRFAQAEMLDEGETLRRAEPAGPFVVALVGLLDGGYANRVAQPAVILRNKRSDIDPVVTLSLYGMSGYKKAAQAFNDLVDNKLS